MRDEEIFGVLRRGAATVRRKRASQSGAELVKPRILLAWIKLKRIGRPPRAAATSAAISSRRSVARRSFQPFALGSQRHPVAARRTPRTLVHR